MKTPLLVGVVAANYALAYPSLDAKLTEIQARHDFALERRSTELLGDLVDSISLTVVGTTIKAILQGASAVADASTYTPPGDLASDVCKQSVLCVWFYIVDELKDAFADSEGCTDLARGAIRQGFHDAATWDKNSDYGGADGSLLLSDELTRSENRGLEEIGAQTNVWYDKYKGYGISMADLIQTAALVGTVSCPGGPRIRHFVGRQDDSRAGPTGKLPLPQQDAQYLIDLFSAKTFTADDLVALIGAHTASKQKFVDVTRSGASQDSTPNVWDNKYYSEVIKGDNTSILIFHSDKSISNYASTKSQFSIFAGSGGQALWSPVSLTVINSTEMLALGCLGLIYNI